MIRGRLPRTIPTTSTPVTILATSFIDLAAGVLLDDFVEVETLEGYAAAAEYMHSYRI
jgi:hypothetical protein